MQTATRFQCKVAVAPGAPAVFENRLTACDHLCAQPPALPQRAIHSVRKTVGDCGTARPMSRLEDVEYAGDSPLQHLHNTILLAVHQGLVDIGLERHPKGPVEAPPPQ